jgi:methionyl-tRNA formyltransferase
MSGIVVAGYSDIGTRCTKWLLDQGEPVRLIYSHPDRPGEERWWESLAELGRARGIPVVLLDDLSSSGEVDRLKVLAPDFLFSFYFRTMIPDAVLAVPSQGALNMHGSLLPQFRGRSPVNWAILKGASRTGASLHYMVHKADAGDLVDQEAVPIGPDDDILAVSRRVGDAALVVLGRAWPKLKAGVAPRLPLDLTKGSYFGARRPEDGQIDWTKSAREVHDLVRAVTRPWPGAFTDLFGPKVTVWKTRLSGFGGHDTFPGKIEPTERSVIVYCGDDRPVEIVSVQPYGATEMDGARFREWVLGHAQR